MSSQLDIGPGLRCMVRTEAGPVAALEAGPADGPPTLLVPGFTGSKEDFGPLLAPLAEAGLHALAVDLPGQLDSPGPDAPERYSPDALAHCVRAVAASMGAPVRLVGHSFGGLVSRAAVIAAPDAFTSLVLLDSGPAALPGPRAERIALLRPFLPELGVVGIYAANEAAEADEPGYVPHPPELAAFYERRFLAGSEAMLLGMGDALLSEPDRVAELAATGVRTLVLFGADDDAWPPALQREMAGRLGAACEMITDAAHSPAVENPDATAAALLAFWEAGGELER